MKLRYWRPKRGYRSDGSRPFTIRKGLSDEAIRPPARPDCFASRFWETLSPPSLRGALATKQSRLFRRQDSGLLRCARNDGRGGLVTLAEAYGLSVTSLIFTSDISDTRRSTGRSA